MVEKEKETTEITDLNIPWKLSTASAIGYPNFTYSMAFDKLKNIASPELLLDFSGTVRYEIEFQVDVIRENMILDLGKVYEIAELWINDRPAGVAICPPYRFNISKYLKAGINKIRVDVTNTLLNEQKDIFSLSYVQEPSRLIGSVRLF